MKMCGYLRENPYVHMRVYTNDYNTLIVTLVYWNVAGSLYFGN